MRNDLHIILSEKNIVKNIAYFCINVQFMWIIGEEHGNNIDNIYFNKSIICIFIEGVEKSLVVEICYVLYLLVILLVK